MSRGTGVDVLGVDAVLGTIVVAGIGAIPALVAAMATVLRAKNEILERNSAEHAAAQHNRARTAEVLEEVRVSVREVDRKISEHIRDHATDRL